MSTFQTATLLPLDYSPNRTEHTLIYVSEDWEELVQILAGPRAYFYAVQAAWPQETGPTLPWTLLEPSTVILQYAGRSYPAAFKALVIAKVHLEGKRPRGGAIYATGPEDHPSKLVNQSATETLVSALKDIFPHGGFIAAFALNTHTLTINYLPDTAKCGCNKGMRFRGMYTNASMIAMSVQQGKNNLFLATVHVDIGSDPVHRAQFVMDYIENSGMTLTKAIGSNVFRKGEAKMVAKGVAINPLPPGSAMPPPPVFTCGASAPFPSLVMETAGDSAAGCDVCTESTAFSTDGANYEADSAVIKCYIPPPPPPHPGSRFS